MSCDWDSHSLSLQQKPCDHIDLGHEVELSLARAVGTSATATDAILDATGVIGVTGASQTTTDAVISASGDTANEGTTYTATDAIITATGVIGVTGASQTSTESTLSVTGYVTVLGDSQTSTESTLSAEMEWGEAIPVFGNSRIIGIPHNDAPAQQIVIDSKHGDAPKREQQIAIDTDTMRRADYSGGIVFDYSPERDIDTALQWDRSIDRADADVEQPYGHPSAQDIGQEHPWDSSIKTADEGIAHRYSHPAPSDHNRGLPWDTIGIVEAQKALPHKTPAVLEIGLRTSWGSGSWTRPDTIFGQPWVVEPNEQPAKPPIVSISSVEVIMAEMSITRVSDGAEIDATSVTLSTDADSWAWTMKADIPTEAALDMVKPTGAGLVEIEVTINTHKWRVLVEGYSESRSFGKWGYTITGRSLSIELATPYAAERSTVYATDNTIAQIADIELTNSGWTMTWGAVDHLVPANSYSYQSKAPISVIKELSSSIGAMLQADAETKDLYVTTRHKAPPLDWSSTTLDAVVPDGIIKSTSLQWAPRPDYNRIFVSGQANGVTVSATRSGTAGDQLAPQVVDPLITHVDAGRERGRVELDKSGKWATVTVNTYLLDGVPGLILPGNLIEIGTESPYTASVGGVSVAATRGKGSVDIEQTITGERFYE